ncbi:MAG: methyltransferase domain-containing protein [Flavobacteriaceae bacterium]|nr:methyltransferase domain-containing protein [Flavobacteriaceae bacterium]
MAKRLLPASWLKKNEQALRRLIAWQYKGSKYQCNICKAKLRLFPTNKLQQKICPNCGSLARTRGLWDLIQNEIKGKTILHFSPPVSLRKAIENRIATGKYITSDFAGEFDSDLKINIEDIDLEDDYFDLIICYHVLEHVTNDKKAISELFRILKPVGICYIQTPFKEGEIWDDEQINTPELRLKHYGQADHLRVYSADGLTVRLEDAGFDVERIERVNEPENHNGFKPRDTILKGRKFNSNSN